jgi:hypothetical protein
VATFVSARWMANTKTPRTSRQNSPLCQLGIERQWVSLHQGIPNDGWQPPSPQGGWRIPKHLELSTKIAPDVNPGIERQWVPIHQGAPSASAGVMEYGGNGICHPCTAGAEIHHTLNRKPQTVNCKLSSISPLPSSNPTV